MSVVEPRLQRVALIAAALIVVVLAFLMAHDEESRSSAVRPSSFLVGAGGGRALYLAAGELGLAPQRWMRTCSRLADEPPTGLLVILAPTEPLSNDEAGALMSWVWGGGNVLYAPGPELIAQLRTKLEGAPPDALIAALGLAGRDGAAPLQSHEREDSFRRAGSDSELARALLADGDEPVTGFGQAFHFAADPSIAIEPLLVDEDDVFGALLVERGPGCVLLLADAEPLTNGELGKSEVAPLALRALAALRGDGPLWFDEFHHGYDEEGGVVSASWRWLVRSDGGHATLCLALVGLLALVCAGLRFGAPIPRPRAAPRSTLAHVEALARAWQRARARRRPKELLLEGLRLRLGAGADLAELPQADRLAPEQGRLAAAIATVQTARRELSTATTAGRGVDPIELAGAVDLILGEMK